MCYNGISISRLFPSWKGALKNVKEKDVTAKIEFCGRERAREKTEDMLTNI